jgi:hypothetical protein
MMQKLSAEEVKDLEEEVSVPYRVEDATVLSEGEWNGLNWTAEELREAVNKTDFDLEQEKGDEQPPNASLFFDHEDRSADQFVGRVENVRMEGDDVKSDLVITDKQTAMNLEFGAPFGVSPKADGLVNEEGTMRDFTFENFSLVVNPAVKTTWLNEDISTVLQDMDIHRPEFRATDERDWNSPNLEDFTDESWEDLSDSEKNAVGRHFLISKSGFPAENYTDLALPVVEPDGTLNLNALQNAKARVSQVSGIDEDEIQRVSKMINNLANGNFEDADFTEVDMAKHKKSTMVEFEYTNGDKVKWESSGGMAMGVVRDRTKDSCFNEEIDGDVEVCGEQDEPAYLIEIFDDEEQETTGTMVGHKQKTLEKADFQLNDIMVEKPMAEEDQETQEPSDQSSEQEEQSVSEDYVTAEELESFKDEVLDSLQEELGDDDEADEEAEDEGDDVEEVEEEASDTELSEFEEFRQENPELSLSEAAERFEEENRDVEEKLQEIEEQFEQQISDLEEKLESKEEEVEELSEKVSNPQRATQASGAEEGKDVREEVAELSDEELHATLFQDMMSDRGVRATKEMIGQ